MEVVTTYKYIADDGREFSSEEACKEWEQQKKRIYALAEQCYLTSQSKILRVFSTYSAALKAAREVVKTNKNNDYSFKVIEYVVEDIA